MCPRSDTSVAGLGNSTWLHRTGDAPVCINVFKLPSAVHRLNDKTKGQGNNRESQICLGSFTHVYKVKWLTGNNCHQIWLKNCF